MLTTRGSQVLSFDCTNRNFMDAYFNVLHHALEDEGVDFWWLDWQQGRYSKIPGIDPLWMLNHYHFLDSGRDSRRPMTFSRYAGPGSHRYPIGFSGVSEPSRDMGNTPLMVGPGHPCHLGEPPLPA